MSDAATTAPATQAAGSSFYAGMRMLPKAEREAMYAIYGFCRAVDDIADAPAPEEDKRAELEAWRGALDRIYQGQASHALERELVDAIRKYGLPREEFDLILEGMLIDAAPAVRIADRDALSGYARRVAGAVGVLSCRIFGASGEAAKSFAIALGETLQITNILRDLDEDAAIDRLYLPLDMIEKAGIGVDCDGRTIIADPRIGEICGALAGELEDRYRRLPGMMPPGQAGAFRSALIMQHGYEAVFRKLRARGWVRRGPRLRLSKTERLATVLAAFKR